jgi:hypothetical protein
MQLKVLNEGFSANQAIIVFGALGHSVYDLPIRLNRPGVSAKGAELNGSKLHIQFTDGPSYQEKAVTLVW